MEPKPFWNTKKVIILVSGILVLFAVGIYFFVYAPMSRKLNTQVKLSDSFINEISQKTLENDSLQTHITSIEQQQKTADSINNSLSTTMNALNPTLASLGIPPLGWNIPRLKAVSDNISGKEEIDLNGDWGSVYYSVDTYCGGIGLAVLKQICIAKGPAIKNIFTKYSKEIGAAKAEFKWPKKINENILPFLLGTNKRFDKDFLAFYKIHSKSKTEGVHGHPGWKKFSENMLKKYPKDFTGDSPDDKLYFTYLDWRSAYVIPQKARKTCGEILKLYNAIE